MSDTETLAARNITLMHRAAAPAGSPTFAMRRVVVFEDRADLGREAVVDVPVGAVAVTFRGLSPLIDEERLLARLVGEAAGGEDDAAQVDDVVVHRRRQQVGLDTLAARKQVLVAERQALLDEQQGAQQAVRGATAHKAAIEALIGTYRQSRSRAIGGGDRLEAADAARDVETLSARLSAATDAQHEALAALARIEHALGRLQQDLEATTTPTSSQPVCDVTVHLSVQRAGPITLALSTVVPCAAWRPTHEAHLRRGEHPSVTMASMAAVWNRTGEPWDDTTVELSTRRPSAGASVPDLTADLLTTRQKTAEEKKTITVAHRSAAVPKHHGRPAVPGVDDGGEIRQFEITGVSIPDDGRPHRLPLGEMTSPAVVEQVCLPEIAAEVFVRASLKNTASSPILAGPVQLIDDGAMVGVGDVGYVGPQEPFALAFGNNEAVQVRLERRCVTEKRLVQKDLEHWLQEATLTSTSKRPERVQVTLRLPVSELAQVKVVLSPHHSTVGTATADAHGLLRVPVTVEAGTPKKVAVAFTFDTTGDVHIPPPW